MTWAVGQRFAWQVQALLYTYRYINIYKIYIWLLAAHCASIYADRFRGLTNRKHQNNNKSRGNFDEASKLPRDCMNNDCSVELKNMSKYVHICTYFLLGKSLTRNPRIEGTSLLGLVTQVVFIL